MSESVNRDLVRSSALLTGAGLISRFLGMAREVLKSHLFGAGAAVSAFDAIYDLHTLLYDGLVGGLQSPVLVPAFAGLVEEEASLANYRRLLGLLVLVYTALLGPLALGFSLAPRFFFALVGAGLGATMQSESVWLMRLMAPLVWVMGMYGLLSAALYARQRFLLPALAPGVFNLVVMGGMLLGVRLGWEVRALGLGVLLGCIVVMAWMGLAVRDTLPLWTGWAQVWPLLRRMALLSLPLLAGMVLDQATVALRLNLISHTGPAGIAWSKYATFVMQVPFSAAVMAVGIAVLPLLTRAALDRSLDEVSALVAQAIRLNWLIVLPCVTLGLVLAEPLIGVLYEHGNFSALDTRHTAQVFRLLLLWLALTTLDQPLNMAFYAHHDTLYPVLANTAGLVTYGLLSLASVALWGPQLLVLTAWQAVQLGMRVTVMLRGFVRRYGSLAGVMGRSARQILGASLLAGGVAAGLRLALPDGLGAGWWRHGLELALAGGGGGAAYLMLLVGWQNPEMLSLGRRLAGGYPWKRK